MGLLLFLLILGIGGVTAFRLLAPEMYVSIDRFDRSRLRFPWQKERLLEDVHAVPIEPQEIVEDNSQAIVVDVPKPKEIDQENISLKKEERIEVLLLEKNKLVDRLSMELEAERAHRMEFEKVKDIMADEIQRLKTQVKGLKNKKEPSNA